MVCLFPTAIGVSCSPSARALRAAFQKDCWLRAWPEGIEWRPRRASALEDAVRAYDTARAPHQLEGRLRRSSSVHKINGIHTGTDLVIVANGWRKRFDRTYFRESAAYIREALKDAAAGR